MEHIATIKHCIEMPKDAQNNIKYITVMDLAGNLVPVDVKGVNGAWGGNVPTQTITRTLSGTYGFKPSATCPSVCSSCGQTLR